MKTNKWIDSKHFRFEKWSSQIQHLKDKVILPNGRRIDKTPFITKDGFDIEGFNKEILKYFENNS